MSTRVDPLVRVDPLDLGGPLDRAEREHCSTLRAVERQRDEARTEVKRLRAAGRAYAVAKLATVLEENARLRAVVDALGPEVEALVGEMDDHATGPEGLEVLRAWGPRAIKAAEGRNAARAEVARLRPILEAARAHVDAVAAGGGVYELTFEALLIAVDAYLTRKPARPRP